MPTSVKKILMPVCCIAILGTLVHNYFVSSSYIIEFVVFLIIMAVTNWVAVGFRGSMYQSFTHRVSFYQKARNIVFIADLVMIIIAPPASRICSFIEVYFLLNALLYTIELYRPGLLPLKEEDPQTGETE